MAVAAVPEALEAGGAEGASGAGAGGRAGGNPLRSRGRHSAKNGGRASSGRQARPPARQSRRGQGQLAPRENAGRRGGQGQLAPEKPGGGGGGGQPQQGPIGRQARKHGPKLARTAYQRIVIAEFVATILIIAAAPVLVPRTADSGAPGDEAGSAVRSLKLSRPLLRMTAACVLFFILALMASGARAGRVAAAGGGLVLLGAALNATDTWAAVGQLFAASGKPAAAASDQGEGQP